VLKDWISTLVKQYHSL